MLVVGFGGSCICFFFCLLSCFCVCVFSPYEQHLFCDTRHFVAWCVNGILCRQEFCQMVLISTLYCYKALATEIVIETVFCDERLTTHYIATRM